MNNFVKRCHVITATVLLWLLSTFSLAASQLVAPTLGSSSSSSSSSSRAPPSPDTGNPSLAILLVILVFAFFITGFCSIYIRHCSERYIVSGAAICPRGIDPETISTFPIMVYSAVKSKGGVQDAALQCAVCLGDFKDMDALRLLPKCGHVFHPECIDAWLSSHVTCPICRAKLKPENAEVKVEIGAESNGDADQVFDESSETRIEFFREGTEGGADGKANGSSKVGAFGVLVRSHSTGHSLRLPEEPVRKQQVVLDGNDGKRGGGGKMKRSASYDVVLQSVDGCSGVGEGSSTCASKGKSNNRWVLSMTPPFVSRGLGWAASSSGVGPNCSGIPRFWAPSLARGGEEECEGGVGLEAV